MKYFYFNKLLLFLCCLLCFVVQSYGQLGIPEVRPFTPNVAALFKVTERPVGSFTGTVPVSFPLMSLSSGPLSVNMTLDYSTSGIRAEEVASSVGLGFSFNDGGGRITQMVNSKPDDQPGGLLDVSNTIRPSNYSCSNVNHLMYAYNDFLDLEPDVFVYSIAGKSGRFSFKEDGTIISMDKGGLKIERSGSGFKMTDETGTEYFFTTESANSYSYGDGSSWSPFPVTSKTWYVTDIYDMNHENHIKFTYVSSGGLFFGYSSGFRILTGSTCLDMPSFVSQTFVESSSNEMILAKVETSSGYILCNSTVNRQDMSYARKINSIEAYDSTGVFKRKVKFNFDYFASGVSKRLKLNNFAEFGASTADSLVYKFDYEAGSLPDYNSPAIDFWGYANGKTGNSSYITSLVNRVFTFTTPYVDHQYMKDEVDRTPSPANAKGFSLSKITYPTGGSRQFIYEGNSVSYYVNFNEFVPDPDVTTTQTFSINSFAMLGSPAPYAHQFFTINSTYEGAYFKAVMNGSLGSYNIKIFRLDYAGQTSGGMEVTPIWGYSNTIKWDLLNGIYRLDVNDYNPYITGLTATWGECTVAEGSYYNREVGGIRIKELRDYDPVSNKTNTTQYFYKRYATDSTKSSGQLVMPLAVTEYEYSTPICAYKRINATGNFPLTTEGSSYVVYPEVRTKEVGNGWNDRVYKFNGDIPGSGNPRGPAINNSGSRGQLESEKIYNQSGTLLKRMVNVYQGASSSYSQGGVRVRAIFNYDTQLSRSTFYPQSLGELANRGWCTTFGVGASMLTPLYAIDSTFSASGVNVVRTDYTYEWYPTYFMPKQVKVTINNGATKEINYKYATTLNADFSFGLTTGEQTMKTTLLSKNYLQPMEITNTVTPSGGSATLLGGTKFIMGYFNTSKIHLASVKEYTSPTVFKETFLSAYDTKGNLQEKYQDLLQRETYLWGYNGQYPVAKIVGSNYTSVSPWFTQSVLDNPVDDTTLRSHLNAIRTNLASSPLGAQVYTYTYDPLVGMTSSTDAKGMTLFYEYDNFGRLRVIKDQDGKAVKVYDYHYKQ